MCRVQAATGHGGCLPAIPTTSPWLESARGGEGEPGFARLARRCPVVAVARLRYTCAVIGGYRHRDGLGSPSGLCWRPNSRHLCLLPALFNHLRSDYSIDVMGVNAFNRTGSVRELCPYFPVELMVRPFSDGRGCAQGQDGANRLGPRGCAGRGKKTAYPSYQLFPCCPSCLSPKSYRPSCFARTDGFE